MLEVWPTPPALRWHALGIARLRKVGGAEVDVNIGEAAINAQQVQQLMLHVHMPACSRPNLANHVQLAVDALHAAVRALNCLELMDICKLRHTGGVQ